MTLKPLLCVFAMTAFVLSPGAFAAQKGAAPLKKAPAQKGDDADDADAPPAKKETAEDIDQGIENLKKLKSLAPESDDSKLEKICASDPSSKKCKEMTEYYKKKKEGDSEAQMKQLNGLVGGMMDAKGKKKKEELATLKEEVKSNCKKGEDYDAEMCKIAKDAYAAALHSSK